MTSDGEQSTTGPSEETKRKFREALERKNKASKQREGEAPGLEADGAGAELAIVDDGFGERDFRTFQEVVSFVLRRTPYGRDSTSGAGTGITKRIRRYAHAGHQ